MEVPAQRPATPRTRQWRTRAPACADAFGRTYPLLDRPDDPETLTPLPPHAKSALDIFEERVGLVERMSSPDPRSGLGTHQSYVDWDELSGLDRVVAIHQAGTNILRVETRD